MIGWLVFWCWYRRQPVGTRSLLLGGHQMVIHPVAVALAWRRIYGSWPTALPYWLAFALHDIGYFGCPNMDGKEGKEHPDRGAMLLSRLCDPEIGEVHDASSSTWYEFSAGHSRGFARKHLLYVSRLQGPDKHATGMLPVWLLGLLYWLSGEWEEYKERWMQHTEPPYPGEPGDNAWIFAGHIKREWERFERHGADPGTPFA